LLPPSGGSPRRPLMLARIIVNKERHDRAPRSMRRHQRRIILQAKILPDPE